METFSILKTNICGGGGGGGGACGIQLVARLGEGCLMIYRAYTENMSASERQYLDGRHV